MTTDYDSAKTAGTLLQIICHSLAAKSGWWTISPHGHPISLRELINNPGDGFEQLTAAAIVAQKLCLIHSEISEAMEGHRKGLMDDHLPDRTMLEVELADAVIRIADLAGALGLDLGGAIGDKLEYNQQRADHRPENREKEGGKAY